MNVTTSVSLALGTYLLSNTGLTGNTSLSVYPYLNTGYNFVVFNLSIDLSPGNVIMWDPTYGTAKIALDTTGCTYPDYSYDLSVVSKLDTTYKWQFYFNAATYLYQQSMKIVDLVVNYSGLYKMQVFWNSVLDYSQYINVALRNSICFFSLFFVLFRMPVFVMLFVVFFLLLLLLKSSELNEPQLHNSGDKHHLSHQLHVHVHVEHDGQRVGGSRLRR